MRLVNMSTFCASLYVGTIIDILDRLGFDTGLVDNGNNLESKKYFQFNRPLKKISEYVCTK